VHKAGDADVGGDDRYIRRIVIRLPAIAEAICHQHLRAVIAVRTDTGDDAVNGLASNATGRHADNEMSAFQQANACPASRG
jgi:hypothetical protein